MSARKWVMAGVALVLALAAYRYLDGNRSPGPVQSPVAPVRVATVVRRNMAVVEQTLGTVVANSTVGVEAQVQGLLQAAYFTEGQFVKKGQLLFQIDPRPYQAALAQAQATLAHDQSLLRNAELDKQRYETLYRQNSTSSQQLDTAIANANALTATVAFDKAAVDVARLNLGYTQIRSPIDGKTGPLLIHPGNLVQPGNFVQPGGSIQVNGPTITLVTINQLQPIKVSFNLPQSDYWRIRAGRNSDPPVAIIERSPAQGGTLSAPVEFTGNAVDSQSGTIELRAIFANRDLSLLPGETVNVTVKLGDLPDALVVPHAALNYGPDGPFVFVIVNRRAIMRPVTVRNDDASYVAIAGDLKPGDTVIVEGQLRVVPGERVKVFMPADIQLSPSDQNLGPQYDPNSPSG
jgi:multidrug efflux system membrane fusion protein